MKFFLRHIPLVIAAIGCGGLLFSGAGRLPLVAQTAGSSKFIQTFLLKSVATPLPTSDTIAPSVATGLKGTAVSPIQSKTPMK